MDYRNIIITSHSKRLRQFISLYFNNFIRKLRFKNCAILKIYFNNEHNQTEIKLLYNGEIDENEDRNESSYYTLNKFNNSNIYSKKLIVPNNINIFLIRHAQGYHNANNTFLKKLVASFDNNILRDPQLTEIGIDQAKKAGRFLNNYFIDNNLNKNLSILFCSILLRTRETLNIILDELEIFDKEIIILPYSNEISNFTFPEHMNLNNHMCNNDYGQRLVYKCDFIKDKNNKMRQINWLYFSDFKKSINNIQNYDNMNMIYQTYIIIAKKLNKSPDYIRYLETKLVNIR